MTKLKPFEKWKTQEVENTFGISPDYNSPTLFSWLQANYPISDRKKEALIEAKDKLLKYISFYNEADISFFFISQVMICVDFIEEKYRAYAQLPMKGTLIDVDGNEGEVNGIAEMVIARGKQIPETPYFFLNEYKPEKKTGSESDPLGQLLIAMLVAQHKNNEEYPIYGCYVNGRNWHFVVLEDKKYAVSNAYNATDTDIMEIYSILMEIKHKVHLRLNLPFSVPV